MLTLTKEMKATLINLAMEGETSSYNWVQDMIEQSRFWSEQNREGRKLILDFLARTNTLTQRLYLELCYVRR